MRTEKECQAIEKYIRSFYFLRSYSHFESDDFHPITKEVKLIKLKRGERLTDYGSDCNDILVIVSGCVAITHPNDTYMGIF